MNSNIIPTNTTASVQYTIPFLTDPRVAIAGIVVLGICYCSTVIVNAKYNRDTDIRYKDFAINIHKSTPNQSPATVV